MAAVISNPVASAPPPESGLAKAARRAVSMGPVPGTTAIFAEDPITLVSGQGVHVVDDQGRRYVDCSAQNLCISLGFAHPVTLAMAGEQMARMQHCTSLFLNEQPLRYAEELLQRLPSGTDWVVHLANSGAEAIDLAFMMARAHTGHHEIVSLRNAYHGLHFGVSGSTAFQYNRWPGAAMQGIVQAMHPDQYRGSFGPDAGVTPYLEELRRTLFSATCGRIAGIIIEPIQGSGGVVPMPAGYMAQAFQIAHEAGGLCISDEVQTGFGRLGSHYWGFEAHGATPDIIVLGKGMGNGFPVSGVVCRREIAESFAKVRYFNTYAGNPVALAAARSVLRAVDEEGLQDNAAKVGAQLLDGLRALQRRHRLIGDVRGAGLMLGIDLVADRATRAPALEAATRIQQRLRLSGYLLVRGSPTRSTLRINPPLSLGHDHANGLLQALDDALAHEPPG